MLEAVRIGMKIRAMADADVELDQALRRKGAQIRLLIYEACDMLAMPYPNNDDGTMGGMAGYFAMMEAPLDFGEEDE
jgi:hypothetical protein